MQNENFASSFLMSLVDLLVVSPLLLNLRYERCTNVGFIRSVGGLRGSWLTGLPASAEFYYRLGRKWSAFFFWLFNFSIHNKCSFMWTAAPIKLIPDSISAFYYALSNGLKRICISIGECAFFQPRPNLVCFYLCVLHDHSRCNCVWQDILFSSFSLRLTLNPRPPTSQFWYWPLDSQNNVSFAFFRFFL